MSIGPVYAFGQRCISNTRWFNDSQNDSTTGKSTQKLSRLSNLQLCITIDNIWNYSDGRNPLTINVSSWLGKAFDMLDKSSKPLPAFVFTQVQRHPNELNIYLTHGAPTVVRILYGMAASTLPNLPRLLQESKKRYLDRTSDHCRHF